MPRMSAEKRIKLGTAMVCRWASSNNENDRSVRFVKDMILRMERGKGLSTRQREWYDKAVLTNPPEPQNKALVDSLLSDAELPGMEKTSQVLRDFAYKLSRGWSLSEKQASFMKKLQNKASDIRENGQWVPTKEQKRQIEIGVAFCRRYDSYYLGGQPGKVKALGECQSWLLGDIEYVDRWSAMKMIELCKTDRAKMTDASDRWPVGSLVETKQGQMGLVVDGPAVNEKGKPCLSLLIDGTNTDVVLDNIKKPRKKKSKNTSGEK